ncbi:serine/threonine-protein kinase STY46-like [Canna indica]|uniref:non-specific serine/threonine protein kinase n=1 Tax=Canna indica TaxID=4628 RepID=A0AAQ3Q946_9LILI|nr:serine/threonine-protein kinase STY46-like [Canna indica]
MAMEAAAATRSGISLAATDSSEAQHPRSQLKQRQEQYRLDVFNEVLCRLREAKLPEALSPHFEEKLWDHFHRLPACYAMDVNVERAEDVLRHMELLQQAQDPHKRPAFFVRLLQASLAALAVDQGDSRDSSARGEEKILSTSYSFKSRSVHPPLGSSSNLEGCSSEGSRHHAEEDSAFQFFPRPKHEITISTVDKPKLLNLLTSLLADAGLNIKEAHAFSTNDGYSLDVFVVDGWSQEEVELLTQSLQKKIQKIEKQAWSRSHRWSPSMEKGQSGEGHLCGHVKIPTDGTDEWELNSRLLEFGEKVASGSFGDLYRGTYCSQDVAIKVLNPERVHVDLQREFAQEVFIMRKIRHKNVVQFIGACTKPPSLCIVTEFMSKGSAYDFLHKRRHTFKLPALVRAATDISKGMNYLHNNNIIHRDLKSSNLLMDENEVVKVADFGVARVKSQTGGVMTAETGTYRWMAPEVIEHRPYDHKADVFSFGLVLWELLTSKLPYEGLTPLQAALGVVQKKLRPKIPEETHPSLAELIKKCWQQNPAQRPDFSLILQILESITKEVGNEPDNRRKKSWFPRGFS